VIIDIETFTIVYNLILDIYFLKRQTQRKFLKLKVHENQENEFLIYKQLEIYIIYNNSENNTNNSILVMSL